MGSFVLLAMYREFRSDKVRPEPADEDGARAKLLLQQWKPTRSLGADYEARRRQNALDFAKKELFEPLGISDVDWGKPDAQNVING